MKKKAFAFVLSVTLVLSLAACGKSRPSETETPAAQPQATPVETAQPQTAPTATETPAAAPGMQDGERYETVIMLEGMEETVRYEHVRREDLGFEMDYDYESLLRQSAPDRERFVSLWDDPEDPMFYLDVRADTGNANLIADVISATLSQEYDLITESFPLDHAGECIRIEAAALKGGPIADQIQVVYVIPASDGCRVATAHYALEGAEGFGRRFAYLVNTLTVLDRSGAGVSGDASGLTDELALSAVMNYCCSENPDLQSIVDAGEYPAYWEIVSSDAQQVVVLFRSYTGALVRYYIDRGTGDASVTEFVPGITPEEMPSEQSLNVWDYVG